MKDKFTVIQGGGKSYDYEQEKRQKAIRIQQAWQRQHLKALQDSIVNTGVSNIKDLSQNDLMKISLAGVKYIGACHKVRVLRGEKDSVDEAKLIFQYINGVFSIMGLLTLKNFVTTFPIEKSYDGDRYQCKDYFYTMDVLNKMDWDKPIGQDVISEFLWDYENRDLRDMYVEYMSSMSAIYKEKTGKGIAEQFCEDNGIKGYTFYEEAGILVDNETGKTVKVKKQRHLQVVKK